jgi:ATPase family associated with various cellular activities (AAA)
MPIDTLIYDGLQHPLSAISYHVSQTLDELYPDKALLETDDSQFDLLAYALDRQCSATTRSSVYNQILATWAGPGEGLEARVANAGFDVTWQGHRLDVLVMSWKVDGCPESHSWILADSREVAEQFFLAVCEWNATVRGEVLVFEDGCWQKSEALYQSIQGTTFDSLILRGSLKREIQEDVNQFLASRATYERYRVPWKRGILFVGPPGNGKTHAVKALLNAVSLPCLYVKSFRSRWGTDHANIRAVFERARQATPCILVLEDLDSLVDGNNRSFFLNELDGFAANAGILTIATTNHPERLDPAILDRPSRFDRKYHFELPAPAERRAYVALWNDALEPEMRPTERAYAQVVERTEGFSFAYLKELFLSSMMRWMDSPVPGGMDGAILAQVAALREQMSSASMEPAGDPGDDPGEMDGD